VATYQEVLMTVDIGRCQQSVSTPASLGHVQHRVASTGTAAELG
jgi:hypothetical protein